MFLYLLGQVLLKLKANVSCSIDIHLSAEMCVYSKVLQQQYCKCTYPEGKDHTIAVINRLETPQPGISEDVVYRLSCAKEKAANGLCADAVQWPPNLGSTKLKRGMPFLHYYSEPDS